MKTKLSIVLMEIPHVFDHHGFDSTKFLVDEDNNFISRYIGIKSIEDTIQDLLYDYTNIDIRLYYPQLVDFFHEAGSSECEVVYLLKLPKDIISLKEGYLLTGLQFNIEEKYERSIRQAPRSV